MTKPNPLNTEISFRLLSLIENKISKPRILRETLEKEFTYEELKAQNLTNKINTLIKSKLVKRKGKNKSSQLEINYPGIIEFLFKHFFNYSNEDLKLDEIDNNDKIMLFLIKDYLNNSCVTKEEIKEIKTQVKNGNAILNFDNWDLDRQTILTIFEMFILGFGRAEYKALKRETFYNDYPNAKINNTETYKLFRELALDYYHNKSNLPQVNYIAEKIYYLNQILRETPEIKESVSDITKLKEKFLNSKEYKKIKDKLNFT